MNRKLLCLALLTVSGVFAQNASVKGKVTFKGTPPKAKMIAMDADPACAQKHTAPVPPEAVTVKADGSLKDVFIYVTAGLTAKTFPAPTDPVTLDQDGCMYKPHVFGIMVNQPLKVVNDDATTHNVHALAETNEEFNVGQRAGQAPIVKSFAKPEVTIPIVCNQHPWMRAVAHVVSNPYYAVSDGDGNFEIRNLPPGKYTIVAIHEKFGSSSQTVTVTAGKPAPLNFTFSAGQAYQPSPLSVQPAFIVP